MPFDLTLSASLRKQGWKVKIFDRERLEEPHVTILFRARKWRLGLRSRRFLDDSPDPADIPKALLDAADAAHAKLVDEWDSRYPENPVAGDVEDDDA